LIITGIPADRRRLIACLERHNQPENADKIPVPSTADTLVFCDECGNRCWIGPRQTQAKNEQMGTVRCYVCIIDWMAEHPQDYEMIDLGGDRDNHPRRM
jgi:hypothetical protein